MSLLLCCAGVVLGPVPAASAAPAASAGVGRVVADLGVAVTDERPGFSPDGGYYAYLVPAGDRCDVRLYDLTARRPVVLDHARVVCDAGLPRWAGDADTLYWQVNAAAGDITVYAWDADPGTVTVLAPDAHVFGRFSYEIAPTLSADGQFLAFTGRSDSHPAPPVDHARTAGYVYDRRAGVSLPLSEPDVHVDFQTWAPRGHHFTARSGGWNWNNGTGVCLGSGTSCRVLPDTYIDFGAQWSADGAALIGNPGVETQVYDFSTDSFQRLPARAGRVGYTLFLGADSERVLGYKDGGGGVIWDRRTGTITQITSINAPYASPDGRWVLFQDAARQTYRYLSVSSGAVATATYRDTSNRFVRGGAWMDDGKTYVGVGPGGCSSLRQWSPGTNTVSLFGPPPPRGCYSGPGDSSYGPNSSASGRFTGASITYTFGRARESYVVDLRRHVLLGPVVGQGGPWAPAGSDVFPVRQRLTVGTARLLLVDPTPVPDVDDKPRWSAATPANGARVEAAVGERVHVELGASDLQQTPVNLYFRWRTAEGVPVASVPKGWSCDRRRLTGGATVADCTFAPLKDHTAVRFVDVTVTNFATGAQSDTRSYLVGTRSVPPRRPR